MGRGRDSWKGHVHTATWKVNNQQRPPVQHTELCSTLCGSLVGRDVWGKWIHVCVRLSPFAVHLKLLTTLTGSTPVQNKKKVQATGPVKDTRVTEMLKRGSKNITYICCEVSYMCVSMHLYIEWYLETITIP